MEPRMNPDQMPIKMTFTRILAMPPVMIARPSAAGEK
jgi:hypothetical protein